MHKKIKVVIAKVGLDSHYRGAIIIARYLMTQGMDVVYIGNQLPAGIIEAVIQEDADVLGLSSLSGNHMTMVPRILKGLKEQQIDEVLVLFGGIIPEEDEQPLLDAGLAGIFGPGSRLESIAAFIEEHMSQRPSYEASRFDGSDSQT
jgi:methylmalonyl-CoA mutase C-terminal domain/subunit